MKKKELNSVKKTISDFYERNRRIESEYQKTTGRSLRDDYWDDLNKGYYDVNVIEVIK